MNETLSLKSILRNKFKVRGLWRIRVQYIVDSDSPDLEEEEVVLLAKDINEALRKLLGKLKERSVNPNEDYQPRFQSLNITSISQVEEEVFL